LIRARAFAKVNLALAIHGRRPDGYHEIETVLQTISLSDQLEFEAWPTLELRCPDLPGMPAEDNIVRKAASLLGSAAGGRAARITLRKSVPLGAGLGGGSSNGAATLLGLCRLWELDVPRRELWSMAASLGSDVPFFLEGGTALGLGRGERIRPLDDLPARDLVVVYPGVHVSTAEAYRSLNLGLTSAPPAPRIADFHGRDDLTWIFNDFEATILPAYPAVAQAKRWLIERGATAALLSGSGSSVFGFFPDEESALAAARQNTMAAWRVFPAKTLSRAEYFQNMFGSPPAEER